MSKRRKPSTPAAAEPQGAAPGDAPSTGPADAAPTAAPPVEAPPEASAAAPAQTPTGAPAEASAEPASNPDESEPVAADAPDGGEAGPEAGAEPGAEPAEAARPRRRKGAEFVPPPPERLDGAVEAMLLASGDVLTAERLRDLLGLASAVHVREALERVRARWAAAGLAVELQDVAGGVRVVTRPEFAEYVRRLARLSAQDPRLSQGQLETLSIVAYRQPVARPEVERIRGVQVGDALRALLERRLIKVVGRSDQPGRPLLYGTTTRFLTAFGLNDVKDLPTGKDLARL